MKHLTFNLHLKLLFSRSEKPSLDLSPSDDFFPHYKAFTFENHLDHPLLDFSIELEYEKFTFHLDLDTENHDLS